MLLHEKFVSSRSALLQMNKRMNEEKSALPMTRGQIENFIKTRDQEKLILQSYLRLHNFFYRER